MNENCKIELGFKFLRQLCTSFLRGNEVKEKLRLTCRSLCPPSIAINLPQTKHKRSNRLWGHNLRRSFKEYSLRLLALGSHLHWNDVIVKRWFVGIMFLFFLSSCEYQTDKDLQNYEGDKLVVDAIITDEFKAQEIFLSLSNPQFNEPPQSVSGAEIYLYIQPDNEIIPTDTVGFIESAEESGKYISPPFTATINNSYYLLVKYLDYADTAYARMNYATPIAEFNYSALDNRFYKVNYTQSVEASFMEINYDWSVFPEYCEAYGNCKASETFYTLSGVHAGEFLAPNKQEIYFPIGTTIKRKQYSLTQQHEAFVRGLLMETEWRGGIFDTEPGNLKNNFRNGSLGFFGVCAVVADSITITE